MDAASGVKKGKYVDFAQTSLNITEPTVTKMKGIPESRPCQGTSGGVGVGVLICGLL